MSPVGPITKAVLKNWEWASNSLKAAKALFSPKAFEVEGEGTRSAAFGAAWAASADETSGALADTSELEPRKLSGLLRFSGRGWSATGSRPPMMRYLPFLRHQSWILGGTGPSKVCSQSTR